MYLEMEHGALINERSHAAVGVTYAIAQALGDKHALKKYIRGMDPVQAVAIGDSTAMATIRERIHAAGPLMDKGSSRRRRRSRHGDEAAQV